jgi:hypothetical protein
MQIGLFLPLGRLSDTVYFTRKVRLFRPNGRVEPPIWLSPVGTADWIFCDGKPLLILVQEFHAAEISLLECLQKFDCWVIDYP